MILNILYFIVRYIITPVFFFMFVLGVIIIGVKFAIAVWKYPLFDNDDDNDDDKSTVSIEVKVTIFDDDDK